MIPLHDFLGTFNGPQSRPSYNVFDWVTLEFEGSNDSKISSTSTNRPIQIRVLIFVDCYKRTVCQYHVGFKQIVNCEAVLPREMSDTTT